MTLETMRTHCRVAVMLERLSEMIAEVVLWVDDKDERDKMIAIYLQRLEASLKRAPGTRHGMQGEDCTDWSVPMDLAVNMSNLFDRPK
jgi:hypothetical protein